MRQNLTPAVALLFGVTQATVGLSTASSSCGQSPFPDPVGAWGAATNNNLLTLSNSTATTLTNVAAATPAQLSCVACIRGGQVWCSNRYLAEKDAVWGTTQVIASEIVNNPAIVANGTGAVDRGQCCFSNLYLLQSNAATQILRANYMSCFAAYTNDAGSTMGNGATSAAAGSATAVAARTDAKFWCSNGYNNMVSSSAAVMAITGYPGVIVAGTAVTAGDSDPRTEFWLIACRQRSDQCGAATVASGLVATLGVAAVAAQQRTVLVAGSPTVADKCSWVYKTQLGAPTFLIDKDATTDVIIDSKWTVHYVEYQTNTGYGMTYDGTSYVFDMHQNWNKFMGRYYNTAMYNGWQEYGNVWQYRSVSGNATANNWQYAKRWFPIAVVGKQVTAYNALVTAYNNAVGSYNTEKTAYNTVVGDLKTYTDDTNAFKAAKTFDVPTRPNKPNQLHAYDGLRVSPYASTTSWTFGGTNSQLTSVIQEDVVISGNQGGGWGSFTAGIIPTATVKAAHSFGVFGWSDSATDTNAQNYSYLQSLPDMCSNAAGTTNPLTNQNCPPTGAVDATTWNVIIVSVWANDVAATAFASGGSGATLKVSFGLNKWAQVSGNWNAPSQPGAATDPDAAPAAAKFMTATATAAVAIAAALY